MGLSASLLGQEMALQRQVAMKLEKEMQVATTVLLSLLVFPLGEWLFRVSTPLGWAFLGLLALDITYLIVQEFRGKGASADPEGRHRQGRRIE